MRSGRGPSRPDRDLPADYREIFRDDALVLHPHQIKSMRWRNLAAGGAVAGGERRAKIIGAPLALADMHKRAHHRAHLMMQERARRRCDPHFVAVAGDVQLVERLHRRFGLTFGGAEGGEIVPADEPLRPRMHRYAVERPRHAPYAILLKREIGAAIDD